MQTSRRFQIASSLARILRRQFGINDQIAEGHFPSQHDRGQYVSIARDGCHLVLTDAVHGADAEQRTEIPRVQAEALLEVSPQRIAYGRTELQLVGQGRAWADFFVKPGSFDLLSVVFDDEQTAAAFVPPPWFGPEVTSNPAFGKRSIALAGLPDIGEPISVSDSALHHLLNMIEGRRPQSSER